MSEIKTWKERLQNPIYGYPEEMQCREDEVDELRTRIYQLEQELAAIKQQFIKYENSDAYELDMMIEYVELKTLIMSIKESSK